MNKILFNCQKWCRNWCDSYSLNLVKFKNNLYVEILFSNGKNCYYKTDLHSITEMFPDGKEIRKWQEMGARRKLELLSDHIIDIDLEFPIDKCELYAEILCGSLNDAILK